MGKALRLFFVAFLVVAMCAGLLSVRVAASQTISYAFQASSIGEALRFQLSGQSVCQITLNQQAAGTVLTPQVSANGGTSWVALTSLGGGSISQTGVYVGNVDSVGYPLFRLLVVSVTGSVTGNVVCGDALPVPLWSGQGGGGVSVAAIASGKCTSPNPGTGIAIVDYVCATPTTAPVISVTSTPCGAAPVGGLFSVTIPACQPGVSSIIAGNCTSPNPGVGTAKVDYTCPTPNPVYSGVCTSPRPTAGGAGIAIDFTCSLSATPNPYESALLSLPSTTHLWKMHDLPAGCGAAPCTPGPCSTGAAITDSVAAGATALASPVPLTVVTTSPVPAPICGMGDILTNNSTNYSAGGIGFCYANATAVQGCGAATGHNSYLTFPSGTIPAPPFTVGCLTKPMSSSAVSNIFFGLDNTTKLMLGYASGGDLRITLTALNPNGANINPAKQLVVVVVNTTSLTQLYDNGIPVSQPTSTPAAAAATVGTFGATQSATNTDYGGELEDCFTNNTALTQAQIDWLYQQTGL